jgi:hypothetical protein
MHGPRFTTHPATHRCFCVLGYHHIPDSSYYYHWTRVANRPRVANRISDNNTPYPSLLVVRVFLETVSMIWFRFLFIKIGAVEGAGVAYMSNKGVLGVR